MADGTKINAVDVNDADEATVEVIASSDASGSMAFIPSQSSYDGDDPAVSAISLQLVPSLDSSSTNIGHQSSNDIGNGGVEELQTFLNNFNSELAADSEQHATVRLVDSCSATTSENSSYTVYETSASASATLIYENSSVSTNAPTTGGLQIDGGGGGGAGNAIEFRNVKSEITQQGEFLVLPESISQHFQVQSNGNFTFAPNSDNVGRIPEMMQQSNAVIQEQQQQQPRSSDSQQNQQQQQILIPIDCSNALVNGNQIAPGSTVLLPVIPTILANGTIEVRIAGNAITLPSSSIAQSYNAGTSSGQENQSTIGGGSQQSSHSIVMQQQQPQQILVFVGNGGGDGGAAGGQPSKAPGTSPTKVAISKTTTRPTPKKPERMRKIASNGPPIVAKTVAVTAEKTGENGEDGGENEKTEGDEKETERSPKALSNLIVAMEKGGFQCEFCDYTNVKKYLLIRHMKSHSEDRPHVCTICEKRFKTANSLQNHVNTHTGTRPHQCQSCQASFTTSGEMVRHMRYKHTQEKPHKCPDCNYASVEMSKLKRHLRSHTGEKPYMCPRCEYASPDMYKLKRHMRVHTGEKPYECDVCLQRFTQSNSLKAHKLIHSGNKPIYQCEYCSSSCGRKTDLKIHIQKLHTATGCPLVCKKCSLAFPDRFSLKQHLRSHDGERCFNCIHCNYAGFTQRHLDVHAMVHQCDKPFECPSQSCAMSFRQKVQLKKHLRTRHGPESQDPQAMPESDDDEKMAKRYECALCGKRFGKKSNLRKHAENHRSAEIDEIDGDGSKNQNRGDESGDKSNSVAFIESENEESDDDDDDEEDDDEDEDEDEDDEMESMSQNNRLFKCGNCDASFRQRVQLEQHCQLEHIAVDINSMETIFVSNSEILISTNNFDDDNNRKSSDLILASLLPNHDVDDDDDVAVEEPKRKKTKIADILHMAANLNLKKGGKFKQANDVEKSLKDLERRRQLDNCFGFGDLDEQQQPSTSQISNVVVESMTNDDEASNFENDQDQFESMQGLLGTENFDSGDDDDDDDERRNKTRSKTRVPKEKETE